MCFCVFQVNEGVREKENSDRLEWIQAHVQCEGLSEVTSCTLNTQILSSCLSVQFNYHKPFFSPSLSFSNSCLTPSPTVSVPGSSSTAGSCLKPRAARSSTASCSMTSCCWRRWGPAFLWLSQWLCVSVLFLNPSSSPCPFLTGNQTFGLVRLGQSVLLENAPAVSHVQDGKIYNKSTAVSTGSLFVYFFKCIKCIRCEFNVLI